MLRWIGIAFLIAFSAFLIFGAITTKYSDDPALSTLYVSMAASHTLLTLLVIACKPYKEDKSK